MTSHIDSDENLRISFEKWARFNGFSEESLTFDIVYIHESTDFAWSGFLGGYEQAMFEAY